MSGKFAGICTRLEEIAEELTELSIVALKESIDVGSTEAPIDEKRLIQARRAVEKALRLLDDRETWS
tara:strand:+ start:470 stop:670 length:201 start_codon:yes stop_codon:yes gene_type:complete